MTTNSKVNEILAPPDPPGPIKWVRDNLFSPWYNSLLTIVSVVFLYFVLSAIFRWAFLTADWTAVTQAPLLYAIGQYPREEMWRVGASLSLLFMLIGLSWGNWGGMLRSISIGAAGFFLVLAILPVTHNQLDTNMRIYLGATALLVPAGYLIGRLRSVKGLYIILGWLLSPVVIITLISGVQDPEALTRTGTYLLFLMLGLTSGKLPGAWRYIPIVFGAGAIALSLFTLTSGAMALGTYYFIIGSMVLVGFLVGRLEVIEWNHLILGWVLSAFVFVNFIPAVDLSKVLPSIRTTSWGGLLVTFILAAGGILLSFPIGLALALGRRSSLPVVSAFSTIFIETIRGVPLVTILFMFSIILALFLPEETRLDRLLRALMAVTVFSAAYTAENVRGGLQAVPPGQIEAAKALGMNNFQTMSFIVLPQAIRTVLPAIVGQFISLFKDTTLVVIVGINDFLGIGRSIINSTPEFVQLQLEVYIFIALVYMVFSYLMSMASRRLETRMGAGDR